MAKTRCSWCGTDPIYVKYHDEQWGVPVYNDKELFAKLILDGAQAGLSWITILKKQPAFEQAFHQFDPVKVAAMTDDDVERLMTNKGIIRSRAKLLFYLVLLEILLREEFVNLLFIETVGLLTEIAVDADFSLFFNDLRPRAIQFLHQGNIS